jgi:hypothetical protein
MFFKILKGNLLSSVSISNFDVFEESDSKFILSISLFIFQDEPLKKVFNQGIFNNSSL